MSCGFLWGYGCWRGATGCRLCLQLLEQHWPQVRCTTPATFSKGTSLICPLHRGIRGCLWRTTGCSTAGGPSRVAIALLAICTALCALAGHGQEAYYAGLGIGLLFVIDAIWLVIRRAPRRLGRLLACAGAAGVLALLLSGVQLLPQLATLPFTVRGGELALRDAWSFSSSLRNLAQLVFPFTLGCYTHDNYSGPWNYWEGNLGVGLAVIIAAILGFTLGFRDRNVRRLGLLALFSVLFALGKEGRVFEVLYRVLPGVAMFRAPGRMLFWFTTLVPVLAALGLHRLWERVGFCSPRAGFWVTVFVAFAGGAASVVMPVVCGVSPVTPFVSWARATAPTHNVLDALVLQGGAALGVLTFAAVLPVFWAALADNRPMARPAHGAVFLALLGGCMLQAIAGARHLIRVVPAREAVPMELASAVKEAMSRCPEQPCRVLAASGLIPDTAAVMAGIEKVTGYDAFQLRGFAMALSAQGTGDPTYILRHYDRDPTAFPAILWTNEFLDAWGVHFVLASRDWVRSRLVDPGGWHEVPLPRMGRRDVVLLQRVRPAPRYRLKMPGNRASAREAVHLASVNDPTAGRWQFVVSAEEDGQFEIAHPYAPGIRVLVDGETTEALSDEHAVLVVRLNKGEHRVAVEYRPPWFLTGCLCTACGLLAAVGLVLWPFRRRGGDPAQARVPEACRGAA